MSSFCKVGAFDSIIGTGNQSITGLGFRPKGLIVWSQVTGNPSLGFFGNHHTSIGITDGTTSFTVANAETDVSIPGAGTSFSTTLLIVGITIPSSTLLQASFVSFDADGFTISWDLYTIGTSTYYMYMAFGGDDVSCKVGTFNGPSGASQVITGVGFKPTGLINLYDIINSGGDAYQHFGWADGLFAGRSSYGASINSSGTTSTYFVQKPNTFLSIDHANGNPLNLGNIASFDNDGFTINWNPVINSKTCRYLAIKGLIFRAGTITQPLVTGIQTIIPPIVNPKACMIMSCNAVSAPVQVIQNRFSQGAFDLTTQGCIWYGSGHGVPANPQPTSRRAYNDAAVVLGTENTVPANSVINAKATAVLTSNGFTLNWTIVDATARELYYLAIGPLSTKPIVSAYDQNVIGSGPDVRALLSIGYDLQATYIAQTDPTTFLWTKVAGPGDVTFATPTALACHVNFSKNGIYELRITATVGSLFTWDNIIITVLNLGALPGSNPSV